jgi:hypothetical protein
MAIYAPTLSLNRALMCGPVTVPGLDFGIHAEMRIAASGRIKGQALAMLRRLAVQRLGSACPRLPQRFASYFAISTAVRLPPFIFPIISAKSIQVHRQHAGQSIQPIPNFADILKTPPMSSARFVNDPGLASAGGPKPGASLPCPNATLTPPATYIKNHKTPSVRRFSAFALPLTR